MWLRCQPEEIRKEFAASTVLVDDTKNKDVEIEQLNVQLSKEVDIHEQITAENKTKEANLEKVCQLVDE